MASTSGIGGGASRTKISIYQPNIDEFRNFSNYIKILEKDRRRAGLVIVKAPDEWLRGMPRIDVSTVSKLNMRPIKQTFEPIGHDGSIYWFRAKNLKKMSCGSYLEQIGYRDLQPKQPLPIEQTRRVLRPRQGERTQQQQLDVAGESASTTENYSPANVDQLIDRYWSSENGFKMQHQILYGSDVSNSFFPKHIDSWNLNNMAGTLVHVTDFEGRQVEGIHTPYCYFGSKYSSFVMHTEDCDLLSINYQHCGASKVWMSIDEEHAGKLERAIENYLRELNEASIVECPGFMRHKCLMLSPDFLRRNRIPWRGHVQNPGDFVITFPRVYHQGFNQGFNVNEAVNFGTSRWVEYAKNAKNCTCGIAPSLDIVRLVAKMQRTRFARWQAGEDIVGDPEDPAFQDAMARSREAVFETKIRPKFEETREVRKETKNVLMTAVPAFLKFWATSSHSRLSSKSLSAFRRENTDSNVASALRGVSQGQWNKFLERNVYPFVESAEVDNPDLTLDADLVAAVRKKMEL